MGGHRTLLAVTWTAVTVAAVCIAWLAVSNAVANVADPVPAVIAGRSASSVHAVTPIPPVTASTAPEDQSGAVATAVPSSSTGDGTAVPFSEPTTAPSTPPTAASAAAPSTVVEPADDSTSDAPPATKAPSQTQSFNSAGGVVTMSCRDSVASLVSATPNQGYTVSVDNSGPEAIEVTFHSASRDAEFHGGCAGGVPTADVSDD